MASISGPFGSGAFGTSVYSNQPFFTTKGLIDEILKRTNHSNPSIETDKRQVVLTGINNRYAWIAGHRHWNWLFSSVDFNFKGVYDTGTVSVTKGSQTITGVGTGWSAALIPGHRIIIGNFETQYSIETVNSSTSIDLASEIVEESQTDLTYKIVKNAYEMPAELENVQSVAVDGVGELVPLGTQDFRRMVSSNPTLISQPRFYTVTARRPQDGIRTVEVWPWPDEDYNCHIDFGCMVMRLVDSDDDFPLIPDRYRHILFYGGLSEFAEYLRLPEVKQSAEAAYIQTLTQMQNDSQLTDSDLILQPARNYRSNATRRRYKVFLNRKEFSQEG